MSKPKTTTKTRPETEATALAGRARSLRAFNRFYTRRIGVVGERVLGSAFTLAQTRVLWELAHAASPGVTATGLCQTLGLDAGYLSRLLSGLVARGLVHARPDAADRRRRQLSLTPAGRRAFAPLERRSQAQTMALLLPLAEDQQHQLLEAVGKVEALLGGGAAAKAPGVAAARAPAARAAAEAGVPACTLRAAVPGDIGWVISRHGALYAAEYGWDWRFEAMVARIAADVVDRFDPAREACWIAQRTPAGGADGADGADGAEAQRLGCVFLVQARDETTGAAEPGVAQLRMLLVEPAARGLGLGKQLVATCEAFARQHGYRRIRLWTNSVLLAARGIYRAAGYQLKGRERHTSFGKKLVGEVWELAL